MKFRRIIDDKTYAAYNIYTADINNDGKLELLASNHDGKTENAAVWCYKIPNDV